ncbi:MAG: hypothetical protein LEGION0398_MBIBDBAK_00763 [Legionellaceae bacterium]
MIDDSETDLMLLAHKKVTVRIWTSGVNMRNEGHSVGHVSVETPREYMSLWPKQAQFLGDTCAKEEGKGIFEPISYETPNLKTDERYEGREPEAVYEFYTLDPDAIEAEFDSIKKTLKGWSLFAVCENGESCASLAYRLLQAGGIESLISKTKQSSLQSNESSSAFFKGSKHSKTAVGYKSSSRFPQANEHKTESRNHSIYSIEMGVGRIIKSPDALSLILKEAQLRDAKNLKGENDENEKRSSSSNNYSGCHLM